MPSMMILNSRRLSMRFRTTMRKDIDLTRMMRTQVMRKLTFWQMWGKQKSLLLIRERIDLILKRLPQRVLRKSILTNLRLKLSMICLAFQMSNLIPLRMMSQYIQYEPLLLSKSTLMIYLQRVMCSMMSLCYLNWMGIKFKISCFKNKKFSQVVL